MVHLTIEIKDNNDQVLNTTRLFGKPYQKEKRVQTKTKVEKLLRLSYPYHIVTLPNSNYGNFSISKACCLYTGFLDARLCGEPKIASR